MTDEAVRKAQAAAIAAGWRVLFEPAIPSAGSALSAAYNTGGVAIAVRAELTIAARGDTRAPGRLISAIVSGAGLPAHGVLCISGYLQTGQKDSQDNRELLAIIGEEADIWGRGFVVGADFQMPPALLTGIGFGRRLGAAILAPDDGTGTIRNPLGEDAVIDYLSYRAASPPLTPGRLSP